MSTDRLKLHLLRHADAGDSATWVGDDAERPLSRKGRRQSELLGRFLAAGGFRTDAMITSPLVRAAETAELVAAELVTPVLVDERLGSGCGPDELVAILAEAGDPVRPVLVGHDPDFSELASWLTGAVVDMKKGSMARIDLDGPPGPGSGRLRWLLPPDLLAVDPSERS
jgi:phosphohistidine phosphatase